MLCEYNKKTLAGVYKELEVNGIFLVHGKKDPRDCQGAVKLVTWRLRLAACVTMLLATKHTENCYPLER